MNLKQVNGAFHLPIETVTIVPSTRNKTEVIPEEQYQRRVEETKTKVRELFGGSTRVEAYGEYQIKDKNIPEKVSMVYAFATREKFKRNKAKWLTWVKKKKIQWSQENIGIIIENDMYYV